MNTTALDRRSFLKLSSAAVAAAAIAPAAFAAEKQRGIQKAIMWSTVGSALDVGGMFNQPAGEPRIQLRLSLSVLQRMQLVKAAGFLGVEPMGAMNREDVIAAIDRFKKENGRPFPSWSEILLIVRQLGYKRS